MAMLHLGFTLASVEEAHSVGQNLRPTCYPSAFRCFPRFSMSVWIEESGRCAAAIGNTPTSLRTISSHDRS
ncbi:unnamed protein product, partial [Ectocarpus sp. 12 AP-2014]